MKHIKSTITSLFTIMGFILATSTAMAGEYPDLTIDQLNKAIEANAVVVIDANGSEKYAQGHIPGAIDFSSVEDLSTVLPEDKSTLIVAYCGGPQCGAFMKPAKMAKRLGYTNVKHLSAGISGWKKAGKPVDTAASN